MQKGYDLIRVFFLLHCVCEQSCTTGPYNISVTKNFAFATATELQVMPFGNSEVIWDNLILISGIDQPKGLI